MKRFLLCVSFIAFIISVFSQSLDYQNRYVKDVAYKVLTPTLKNLKTLVNCSQDQFIGYMKQYGYKPEVEPSEYTHISYSKMPLDFYMDSNGYGANTIEYSEIYHHIRFTGKMQNIHPKDALINLHKEIAEYQMGTTDNGANRFVLKENPGGYVIEILTQNGFYYIDILRLYK